MLAVTDRAALIIIFKCEKVSFLLKENTYKVLLLFFLILFFAAAVYLISVLLWDDSTIHPADAVLDLNNWEPGQSEALSLTGQWAFYWERILSPGEAESALQAPDVTVNIPSVWNNYILNGKKLPGYGYGTYLLKVVNVTSGKQLSLRIPTFSTAYDLYINDRLVSSNGTVAKDKEHHDAYYNPQIVTFTPNGTSFDIMIHVSNFTYARGGMWYAINLGTPEQIAKVDRTITIKDLLLFGSLITMAFYYLMIFLLRREDKSSLYFVFMCIIFASRTAIYGSFFIYSLLPDINFRTLVSIDYITLCCFSVCAAFMIGELFPKENHKHLQRSFLIYASAMTLIFNLTPISFFTRFVYLVQALAILIGAYSIATLIVAYLRDRKDALTLLTGSLVVISCAIHDIMYHNNVILSNIGELVPFGLFILLFLQAFVLARRFSEAFKDVHTLSQKLLTLDRIKDEFLANTSHELRTPLSGILGITGAMLKGSDGELNEQQRQNLSIMAASGRRLANLVNDILDYSKMKNGDIQLNIRPVQIRGLIVTVIDVFKHLSISKDCDIFADIPEDLPAVMADENRVAQILYNLVGNAVKFTVDGSVKVSVKKIDGSLEFCVSDTGIGIPENKLDDIFKSFEQVDSSLTRRRGGTGLGLPITKHLVELQGGTIRVESDEGSGSRFYFTLPMTEGAIPETDYDILLSETNVPAMEEIRVLSESKGDPNILLVDDDTINLLAASSILRTEGYGITVANSGNAALEILKNRTDYSLVILDVMMPEISGYEVCRRLRENKSGFELPILMLTAKASTEDLVTGFQAGANDYLFKPFEPEELIARVKTLTGLKISVDKAISAEMAFMQAQIKPHFLFNTLNAISSFCDSDPVYAQKLIDEFAIYLRHSFDFKSIEDCVALETELNMTNSYIKIEKARFGDKLQVEFDIDQLLNAKVPFLSIQPLVENAINHGLRKKGGFGIIKITVKKIPDGILVAVVDNGQGMEPDKLAKLLITEASKGIGLRNIDGRLKKLFGKGLSIESTPGKGTRVSYFIPMEVIE